MKGKNRMDGQYSWRRTQEIELDLADLLRKLCMKWKQILACALVFTVISGGYGYWEAEKSRQAGLAAEENPVVVEDIELTEEEEREIEDAIRLEKEITELEKYMENSILMQADPYHKSKVVMLYSISQAKGKELQRITESYLNFIVNGGAASALKESENKNWDMDKSYLDEVISAYQKTAAVPYQIIMEYKDQNDIPSETFLYVEVTGRHTGMAEQLAKDMQSVLKTYSSFAQDKAGKHKLLLLGSETDVTVDSSLQAQQHEKRLQLSANRSNLKTAANSFSEEQMAVYKSGRSTEKGRKKAGENLDAVNSGFYIKYIFLGLAGGIFLYCCGFVCWYLFRGTVKNAEELKERYTFAVYGSISLKNKTGRKKEKLSSGSGNFSERETAKVLNRIRLVCRKKGITRLCAASEFAFEKQERECMENIAQQLQCWGIDTAVCENASADTAVWDMIADMGNVLLICKADVTTHQMIDEAMSFYMENAIAVAGAVVFS